MMFATHFKLAWETIKRTKWRSLFTSIGIVIGIVSVLLTVGLGEGVKREVSSQIKEYGQDVLFVRPGQGITRDDQGNIVGGNLLSENTTSGSLSDNDVEIISNFSEVQTVVPVGVVNGLVSYDDKTYSQGTVLATSSSLTEVVRHKVAFGEFFNSNDEGRNFVVVGRDVARQLFEQDVPIGKALEFRGQRYIVKGVFDTFKTTPFSTALNYNQAIFLPYTTGKAVNDGSIALSQILVKPEASVNLPDLQRRITERLQKSHGGQADFAVLSQEDSLALTDNTLQLLTSLIGTVAIVALLVGGIGVMNIMIASVTERTHEIGVRKAVGATDSQILNQFLAESILLSAVGGVAGVVITYGAVGFMHLFTGLKPVVLPQYALAALLLSMLLGILFGVAPAIKAARKDPIAALRRE